MHEAMLPVVSILQPLRRSIGTAETDKCHRSPHFLCRKAVVKHLCVLMLSHSVMSNSVTLWPVACQAPLSWDFPGKRPVVGCYFLLQVVFLTQRSSLSFLCFLPWQMDSSPLSHLGIPLIWMYMKIKIFVWGCEAKSFKPQTNQLRVNFSPLSFHTHERPKSFFSRMFFSIYILFYPEW